MANKSRKKALTKAEKDAQERQIQLAIDALEAKKVTSIREAAKAFDVNRCTLGNRWSGKHKHPRQAHQHQQRLTPTEEDTVVKAVYQLDAWGWPMTIDAIRNLATQLLLAKGDTKDLGVNWHLHFLDRHEDLRTRRSRAMDQARKDSLDYNTAVHWFELFQTTRLKYAIPDDDIYNMDEKGCMKGIGQSQRVIVPRRECESFVAQPGNREWVSIIECISASGFLLPPFVIFEGQRIQQSWIPKNIDENITVRVSPKGWTDCKIALEWLDHFNEHTKPRTLGKHRLLILDGHASHISPTFVQYCVDKDIVPLCLPPHATHKLQPLDVGVFGPLANAYRGLVNKGSIFGAVRINNHDFLLKYELARKTMRRNIAGAWRGAGLVPANPGKILDELRPKTPPFVTAACSKKPTELSITQELTAQLNAMVDNIVNICTSPLKKQVAQMRETCLSLQADKIALVAMNQELVNKRLEGKKKSSRKHFGQARVLTVKECKDRQQQRESKEAEEQRAKARRAALRGVVGFAKVVWKEMPVAFDYFED